VVSEKEKLQYATFTFQQPELMKELNLRRCLLFIYCERLRTPCNVTNTLKQYRDRDRDRDVAFIAYTS